MIVCNLFTECNIPLFGICIAIDGGRQYWRIGAVQCAIVRWIRIRWTGQTVELLNIYVTTIWWRRCLLSEQNIFSFYFFESFLVLSGERNDTYFWYCARCWQNIRLVVVQCRCWIGTDSAGRDNRLTINWQRIIVQMCGSQFQILAFQCGLLQFQFAHGWHQF